jgi:hypothetical protein
MLLQVGEESTWKGKKQHGGKLNNVELHNLFSSPNSIRVNTLKNGT